VLKLHGSQRGSAEDRLPCALCLGGRREGREGGKQEDNNQVRYKSRTNFLRVGGGEGTEQVLVLAERVGDDGERRG